MIAVFVFRHRDAGQIKEHTHRFIKGGGGCDVSRNVVNTKPKRLYWRDTGWIKQRVREQQRKFGMLWRKARLF